ncbi:phage tail length tape measure family protein [Pseudomonas tolaasii]|uniref:Phage tail length tape measure family protein n=1 Tax=Pseudomonas tolaasii TaxID=29442 RepID=A0A7Y8AM63_PSETO|nr:phage tail length tape measure family protein [Pseudomonas tolaasii]NWC20342.1 phage tail length tape measure family protein [Pseudomonas tolaasii]NWC38344.1 phage tail length tape measure family protein [Pseudomonas tolaasii]NWD35821.1 phage tail length tape measure family protein [Pseudomonas tolaasii]
MTQTSRLVLEIDSRDAEQKAADARKALEALEAVGIPTQNSMKKAASGIDDVGKSSSKAVSSVDELSDSSGKAGASSKKAAESYAEARARIEAIAKSSLDASTYLKTLSASTEKAGASFDAAASKAASFSALQARMKAESDANVKSNGAQADVVKKSASAIGTYSEELEKLLAKLDPVRAKQLDLVNQQKQLAAAFKKGDIDEAGYKRFSAIIGDNASAMNSFSTATKGSQRDAAQLLNALKSGDWQGVARNFQQISVSAGGAGNAFKSLGGMAGALINPATIGAAAIASLGLAFYDAEKEASQFNKALYSGSASSGQTAIGLSALAKDAASLTGNFSSAKDAVIALAGAGRLSETQFTNLATAAASISEFTGKGAGEVAKALGEMGGSATEAAQKISSQYGLLTSAQYEVIAGLDAQGKKQEALDLLSENLNKNAQDRLVKYKQSLSTVEQGWDAIGTAISNAYRNIRSEVFPDLNKEIEIIERILKAREDGGVTGALSSAFGFGENSTDNLRKQLDLLKNRRDTANETARAEGEAGRAEQARIEAQGKWDALHKKNLLDQAKLENDIKEAKKLGLEAGRSQAEIDKEVANIQAKFDKSQAKPKAYREDAGMKALDAARQTQAVLIQQNASLNAQGIATEKVGAQAQALIKWEQQLADIKGKKTLTADQKSLLASQDLITAQLKKNVALEREAEISKGIQQAQKDQVQLLTLTGQLREANSLKSSLDDAAQMAEYERQGNVEAAKRLETMIKIRDINLKAAQKPGTVEGVTQAPTVPGLDASVGGAGSEIARLDEAAKKIETWRATELEKQAAYLDLKAINEETYAARVANIDQQATQNRQKIEEAKNQALLVGAADFFGNMASLSQSGNKKLSAIGKAAAIAQATISTYDAANKSYAALAGIPIIGPGLGIAAASAAIVAGLANVANIAGVGFSEGGYTGPGGVREYAGPAHKGEIVWSQKNIRDYGGVAAVEALRKGNVSPIRPGAKGAGPDAARPQGPTSQTVNVIEDSSRAGRTQTRQVDGRQETDVFVSDINSNGPRAKAIQQMLGMGRAAR